jgi:hypothetical protein
MVLLGLMSVSPRASLAASILSMASDYAESNRGSRRRSTGSNRHVLLALLSSRADLYPHFWVLSLCWYPRGGKTNSINTFTKE